MSENTAHFSDSMNRLQYRFSCSTIPHAFHVLSFEVVEALNAPYRVRVELVAASEETDTNELLGHGGHLLIEREECQRDFYGVIRRVVIHDDTKTRQTATIELVPALQALAYTQNTRIFQDQTALDILETVLREGLLPYGRSFDTSSVHRERYLTRDYCVQYRETNLDFVHRLLEEEGIGYFFTQEGPEKLVLFDANAQLPRAETLDGGPVRVEPDYREWTGTEPVLRFVSRHALHSTKLTVRDHDWTSGRPTLEGSVDVAAPVIGDRAHEVYDHGLGRHLTIHEDHELLSTLLTMLKSAILPHGLPLGLDRVVNNMDGAVFESFTQANLAHQLAMREQLLRRDAATFEGIGLVTDFAPGKKFELLGHPTLGLDAEYVITRVVHASHFTEAHQLPFSSIDCPDLQYHNRFECLPIAVPWRPERKTPKPRIHGVQTARVTGPVGMNVHTDAHGRILVKFPWDRAGERLDGNYTTWLRVGQTWAGGGGPAFMFIPRIGMEVIVSFVDGDPDRPLVTGCVYNGENPTPGFLPVQATKSIIRTRTVPHADGYNELSFEDGRGMEKIHIRAQQDFDELVLRHRDSHVRANNTQRIDGQDRRFVGRNQVTRVGGNVDSQVGGESRAAVSGNRQQSVRGRASERIGQGYDLVVENGPMSVTVENGQCVLDAKAGLCLTQGPDTAISILPAEQGGHIVIDSRGSTLLMSEDGVEIAVGRSTVRIAADYIQINGRTFPAE
jgi:type VI secretion system secreted protein VgrG